MKLLLDSFWRAGAYLFLPRVMGLTVLPLLLSSVLAVGLGWLFWEPAVSGVRATLEGWSLVAAMLQWIEVNLGAAWRSLVGPVIVLALAVPLVVVLSLLLVAWLATPAVARLVRERRFPALEQRHGASFVTAVLWSVGCTAVAMLALLVSMPLWLIPPLVLIIPPLIWGWLTRQVMGFDVLADTASAAERRTLVAEHRWPLLLIGVVTGYLGAAPSLIWAVGGAAALIFAPVMIAVAVWLYTLVFAFAALWFAHYALAALDELRRRQTVEVVPVEPPAAPLPPVTDAPRLP
ncbi:EI24 domain-containing protein [Ideonella sp. 4Y11]|uniref:EI24 domain-containing protein n=1 Tax=Ideonella aquatica TaxID=2824119 RepID=A0A941BS55_9BURK|nr:EI24 domain-containing protein [Ideonella aquatica]MBQ0961230.1 EI24 domain-containing protein [Ideonella aquatica]